MIINECRDYYRSLLMESPFSPTSSFCSKRMLDTYISSNLFFSYGNVNYSNYQYNSNNYLFRKLMVVSGCVEAGIVGVVSHLARAILYGIPMACIGKKYHFKADLYRVVRDLQEGLGWIVTLFHDRAGSYLVQESIFHRKCYDQFEKLRAIPPLSDEVLQQRGIPYASRKQLRAIFPYRDEEDKRRFALVPHSQIQSLLSKLEDDQLCLISIDQIKVLDLSQLDSKKLFYLFYGKIPSLMHEEAERRFSTLFPHQIQPILSTILEDDVYSLENLITPAQLQALDLSFCSKRALRCLFDEEDPFEEGKRRFAWLTRQQVQSLLIKLEEYQLKYITPIQRNGLDLSHLSPRQRHLLPVSNRRQRRL